MKKYVPLENWPLSKAVVHNLKHTAEISGQIGIDPTTGKLAEGIRQQTATAMENTQSILSQLGLSFDDVIKVRIYLTDMNDYSAVNEVYASYFTGQYPARVAMAVKELPLRASVEIECTAASDDIRG